MRDLAHPPLATRWFRVDSIPDSRKDGRELLLAMPNVLGTADGGDGQKLDPGSPWRNYVGQWCDGRWLTTETAWDEAVCLEANEPEYWADITEPPGR